MPRHPDRHWPLQGASNFRDLGGYAGHGGRPLRWRRLFRSDHLGGLTDADQQRLAPLGLARTFDFRGQSERAAAPCRLIGATRHSLAIEPTVVQRLQEHAASGAPLTAGVAAALMHELYRGLVSEQAHRYAELFEQLLHDDSPLVMHCTAGKDRTGVAAALVLLALGVSRERVLEDYLLSNETYRRPPPRAAVEPLPAEVLAVLWQVQAGFLEAALQSIDDAEGGIEPYLRRRLGLGPAALRTLAAHYLQD
jgi:protein-tyrosine phosphatase